LELVNGKKVKLNKMAITLIERETEPGPVSGEIFGYDPVEILVFPPSPTGCMLTSFRFKKIKFEVYSLNFSEVIGKFPEALNINWLFLKLNHSSVTSGRSSPF
jgi:hypothetical protein